MLGELGGRGGVTCARSTCYLLLWISLMVCAPPVLALSPLPWTAFQELARQQNAILQIPEIPTTAEGVHTFAKQKMSLMERAIERIENRPIARVSFQNTVVALDAVDEKYGELEAVLFLSMGLHQNSETFDAAAEAMQRNYRTSPKWLRSSELRKRVQLVSRIEGLAPEDQELLKRKNTAFETVGNLQELLESSKLSGLWERLSEKEEEFQRNLLRPVPPLAFTDKQLEGLSPRSLGALTRRAGKYLVSPTSYNEVQSVLTEAHSKKTRESVLDATRKVGLPENLRVLREMLALRQSIAQHLEYRSWSAHQLEEMSLTPAIISRELSRLLSGTRAAFDGELQSLAPQHRSEADALYEAAQRSRTALPENSEEYFPYPVVLKNLMEMVEAFYGLEFVQLQECPVWHAHVQVFGIVSAADKKIMGAFALDPHPRPGKDNWFWTLDMTIARRTGESSVEKRPFSVLSANFPNGSANEPPLLRIADVPTLAHELGHILDSVLSQASYYNTAKAPGMEEIRELPSTFLEVVAEHPAVLSRLSGHYQTGKKLDAAVLQSWLETRRLAQLITLRSRSLSALMDLKLHGSKVPGLSALEHGLRQKHSFELPAQQSLLASFGYATGGYDALFWTYLWAEAIAKQMAHSAVNPDGTLNHDYGMHVRAALLEKEFPTTSKALLEKLLGEKPKLCSWMLQSYK